MFVWEYLTPVWLAEMLLSVFVHLFYSNKTIGFQTCLSHLLSAPPPIPCRTTSPKAWPLRLQASAKLCCTHPQHEIRHLNGTEHGRSDWRIPPGICDYASLSNDLHSAERDGLRKRVSLKAGNWIGKSGSSPMFTRTLAKKGKSVEFFWESGHRRLVGLFLSSYWFFP